MTAMKQIGESKGLLHALRTGAATLALMAVSGYALASNVLLLFALAARRYPLQNHYRG